MQNKKPLETITVDELRHRMRIGRNQAYAAIRRKEIPSIRIGRRILIPIVALEELLTCERDVA